MQNAYGYIAYLAEDMDFEFMREGESKFRLYFNTYAEKCDFLSGKWGRISEIEDPENDQLVVTVI